MSWKKKVIAVISIEKNKEIVASNLGVFKRTDTSDEIMIPEEITTKTLSAVANDDFKNTIEEMAQQITQLTISLDDSVKRYHEKNKLSRKILEWIACGIIGIILSMLLPF
ncbi:hypothetical protein [Acetobacterium woodii]|uniref:hypothetical protein n=1 Tax=Acetobacterium woodii TaxID=33952 RepID=UPI0011AE9726|nr:hypothetical protein [Acetobacterium woodii]